MKPKSTADLIKQLITAKKAREEADALYQEAYLILEPQLTKRFKDTRIAFNLYYNDSVIKVGFGGLSIV